MTVVLIILGLIVAYLLGFASGWAVPYIATAIQAGTGIIRAFGHAANEMVRDAKVINRDVDIIDV